jgi:SAM-dependent methyltransferase
METPPAHEAAHAAGMADHFRAVDPHGAVAASKARFYAHALAHLDARIHRRSRALLDVGCGYGYFLERAAFAGWRTVGVDVVPEAVSAARRRVSSARVLAGQLSDAGWPAGDLNAVTLWDVLDMVADPAAELAGCFRVLAPGGIVGIRVRNLTGQLWLYRCFTRLGPIWRRAGIKPPFTFHRFSFTRQAIVRLLARSGFVDIECRNSPLTQGDPYAYGGIRGLAECGKSAVGLLAGMVGRMTGGRVLVGPSLLAWARKPEAEA